VLWSITLSVADSVKLTIVLAPVRALD
jgi:hypothetical protein